MMAATTTTTGPWKPLVKPLEGLIKDAGTAYQSDLGSQPYTGSLVAPMSTQQVTGMANHMGVAGMAQPYLNASLANIGTQAANASGMTPAQQAAMGVQQNIMSGTGLTPEQMAAQQRMNAISGGSMLNANPYLDQIIGQNAQDITRAQQMAASGAGRYGSGGFQAVTQNQIGRMASTARAENYARERAAQDAATNAMFGMGQQGITNRGTASTNVYNMGQAGQQQNILNNAALGSAYNNALAPGTTMQQVGQNYQNLAQANINNQKRIFDEKQAQPWKQMGLYSQALQGGSGQGGTSTTPGASPGQTALGYGALGYQVSGGNPLAAGAAALYGYGSEKDWW
jgi:hypothetical protein